MPDGKLERLRSEIRRLDEEILDLARKRTALAGEIGRRKLALGLPVRDYETEREVFALAERKCAARGLDPTIGREITRALIAGAVKEQEEIHERRFLGTRRRISILGGRGKMGSWLARYLHSRGHRVLVHDPAGALPGFRSTKNLGRALAEAEVVFLSVPLHEAEKVYARVRTSRPEGTIVDIFSLKSHVLGEIRRSIEDGLAVTSAHPLFGPGVYLLSDRILLLCPCGHSAADRTVADLFAGTSLELVRLPVEEHDRAIGIVLGLSHTVNILFTEALARSGFGADELARLATTTFEKQVKSASEVARENARLYYDIQHLNEHTPDVFRLLGRAFESLRRAALSPSPRGFAAMMERGRKFYEEP